MNNNIQERVGARIRAARMMRGIPVKEVGRRIGVSYQQIWKYEVGKSMVSAGTITAIAQLLGMPISFFLEEVASFDMLNANSGLVALLDAYRKLDTARRDLLISIAESLGEVGVEHRTLAAE
jgi:transcriptional regulator with XRE-family HTH domain